MKIVLRLKHWQMFLILFLPIIFTGESMARQVVQIAWFAVYLGWVYIIAKVSLDKIPAGHFIKSTYFKLSFLFVIVYFAAITILFDGGYSINQDNYKEFGNSLWVILPLHIYQMWSILYVFYFAARMLISTIEGKVVGFDKAFGYFFAFCFFPIGVWYIQPKAQQLIS